MLRSVPVSLSNLCSVALASASNLDSSASLTLSPSFTTSPSAFLRSSGVSPAQCAAIFSCACSEYGLTKASIRGRAGVATSSSASFSSRDNLSLAKRICSISSFAKSNCGSTGASIMCSSVLAFLTTFAVLKIPSSQDGMCGEADVPSFFVKSIVFPS